MPKYKVVVLGEGAVGKTSLTVQFVKGTFTDERVKTINATCMEKTVNIQNSNCTLCVWDTAGQEMFATIAPMYYRDSDGRCQFFSFLGIQSANLVYF